MEKFQIDLCIKNASARGTGEGDFPAIVEMTVFNVSMSLRSFFFTPGLREAASRSFTSALAYKMLKD
jgi:hypothetical protein